MFNHLPFIGAEDVLLSVENIDNPSFQGFVTFSKRSGNCKLIFDKLRFKIDFVLDVPHAIFKIKYAVQSHTRSPFAFNFLFLVFTHIMSSSTSVFLSSFAIPLKIVNGISN